MVLRLLDGYKSESFDRATIASVEGLLAENELPWWAGDAVDFAIRRFDPKAPPEVSRALEHR
jgi:hypothetical protein